MAPPKFSSTTTAPTQSLPQSCPSSPDLVWGVMRCVEPYGTTRIFLDLIMITIFLIEFWKTSENTISSSSSRTSDGQSSLADKCCSPLQIREAAVELLGLQGWLGPGLHSQFFLQLYKE